MADETDRSEATVVRWNSWLRNLLRGAGPESTARRASLDSQATIDLSGSGVAQQGFLACRLNYWVESTVGNYREHNEDNFFVPGRPSLRNGPPPTPAARLDSTIDINAVQGAHDLSGLFIVADGMGGQQAGEKASQMAVELIPRELASRLGEAVQDEMAVSAALREAVAAANHEILALSHLGADFQNMGTTVVLALFRGARAFIAGIGDSRAYRLRLGHLEQLTRDHSLADALGEAGTISKEEVERHKFKHVLYLYLGSRDARDGPEQIRVVDVHHGDRFLLASDGLTGVVKDEDITAILAEGDDPKRSAQGLVNRALGNHSKDNVTCLVIHVT